MPVQHAIALLNTIDREPAMREQMYRFSHTLDLFDFLNSKGFGFKMHEFDEAVNILHLKCQSYEEADALFHKADWLRFQLWIPENIE